MEIKGNRGLGFSYSPRIEMLFPHDILRITAATACIWGSGSIYLKHPFIFHVWSCMCAPCMSLSNFCHLMPIYFFIHHFPILCSYIRSHNNVFKCTLYSSICVQFEISCNFNLIFTRRAILSSDKFKFKFKFLA